MKVKKRKTNKHLGTKHNYSWYRRIYTHKVVIGTNYLISFILLMVVTEGYFVFEFIMQNNFYKNLKEFANIYFFTNSEAVGYMDAIDFYKEYYTDPNNIYGRNTPLSAEASNYWNILYKLSKDYMNVFNLKLNRTFLQVVHCLMTIPKTI